MRKLIQQINGGYLPAENSRPLLFVVNIFTLVLSAVFESEMAKAMHHIVGPVSVIFTTVCPRICTSTFHLIIDKFTLKCAPILPGEFAYSMLLTIHILAIIDSTENHSWARDPNVAYVDLGGGGVLSTF